MEESHITERSPVCELFTYHLMRYKPADKNTRQEADDRKKQLTRGEVEEVEHGLAKEQLIAPRPQRQGTDSSKHHAHHRHEERRLLTTDPHLLMQEGRRYLMQ